MIVSLSWPSTPNYGGGVAVLYEYANGLARRGHEVNLIHGPTYPGLIRRVEDVTWFTFEPEISHHIVSSLEDPSLPAADVIFPGDAPARLGEPAVLIQGYKILEAFWERPAYRAPCPKLCVASWLTEVGIAWGSPPEQMLHVLLGIDHERFSLRTPVDERPVDVAMLYNEHPVKGGADGLSALRRVHERRPGLRAELFGLAEPTTTMPDWVNFRLAPSQDELAEEVYARARVFVQPSWLEGFGLTAVEAMASGCALVTTDNGGSRDYALDGETAVVVPAREPASMARAIDALLGDEPRRIRLAQAGVRYVQRFRWDAAAEQLEAHLERYLEDPVALQHPPADAPLFLEQW